MFGTENLDEVAQSRLLALFDRQGQFDSLKPLLEAVAAGREQKDLSLNLKQAAVALDSSVFLRLSTSAKGVDVIDYLHGEHAGPLVLPGQAVQEFWNNHLSVVETVASSLKKKLVGLKAETTKVDASFGQHGRALEQVVSDFEGEFGYVYDESTTKKTTTLLELFQRKSSLCYAPRSPFIHIAEHRKRTRTPPGFEDKGDGDFFIWVDFLYALTKAQLGGAAFEDAIFVTYDQKPDWSRNGIAHPLLTAEVAALLGAKLHVWNIDQFVGSIKKQETQEGGQPADGQPDEQQASEQAEAGPE